MLKSARNLQVASLVVGVILASPILADEDSVTDRLEYLYGEAEPYRTFFFSLKEAVSSDDRERVADLMNYPLRVSGAAEDGSGIPVARISDREHLLREYEAIFAPNVVQALARQEYGELFANTEGVMIGNGQIWFAGICIDNTCDEVRVATIAINRDAPQ